MMLSIIGIIFILMILMVKTNASICQTNRLDQPFYCRCHRGKTINRITSDQVRRANDREWTLHCSSDRYPSKPNCGNLKTDWTEYDRPIGVEFSSNGACDGKQGILTGWESIHSNKAEDRRFKFFYAIPDLWDIVKSTCIGRKENVYGGRMDYQVEKDHVITGVKSYHSNHHEDREWYFTECKLARECNVIEDIQFATDDKTPIKRNYISRDTQVTDATNHTTDVQAEISLSKVSAEYMSDSERYERTSGSKFTDATDITTKAGINIPKIGKVEFGYSKQFTHERTTSDTFVTKKVTEYSEMNGKQMKWSYTCAAGDKCEAAISVWEVAFQVPYTMKAVSSQLSARCQQRGVYERIQHFTQFNVKSVQ